MNINTRNRTNLNKLLNRLNFIESSRHVQDCSENYKGKIGKQKVIVSVWNYSPEYKKPSVMVNVYDNTIDSPVKSGDDLISSYEITFTGKVITKEVKK